MKTGSIDCVVATSTLDLGVDFQAVEQIIQIGSPRSVSRLIQRAGRASHRPGEGTDVLLVPTNRLHLHEYAALADALDTGALEPIRPPEHCLDVLIQHLVTMALQAPWHPDEMFQEVTKSWAYRHLTRDLFDRLLTVLLRGSDSLKEYPEYRRLVERDDGRLILVSNQAARRHRMSIGTIVAHAHVRVKCDVVEVWARSKNHLQADFNRATSSGFRVNAWKWFAFRMVNWLSNRLVPAKLVRSHAGQEVGCHSLKRSPLGLCPILKEPRRYRPESKWILVGRSAATHGNDSKLRSAVVETRCCDSRALQVTRRLPLVYLSICWLARSSSARTADCQQNRKINPCNINGHRE